MREPESFSVFHSVVWRAHMTNLVQDIFCRESTLNVQHSFDYRSRVKNTDDFDSIRLARIFLYLLSMLKTYPSIHAFTNLYMNTFC